MKLCSKCHIEKPLNEFRNDKYTSSGKTTRCKSCLTKFISREVRCIYCREWFTKTQSSYKFCRPKCRNSYWNKIYRLSTKGRIYFMLYHRTYDKMRKGNYTVTSTNYFKPYGG